MTKLTSFGAVALAAFIGVLVMLGFQAPAQAYPEAQVDVSVDHQTVQSGESFTATASSDVHCDWTLEWDKRTQHGESSKGSNFQASFKARPVKSETQIPLRGTCSYTDASEHSHASAERTIMITVQPRGATQVSAPGAQSGVNGGAATSGAGGADLPNTGGPNRMFLAGGLVLLISGAAAITLARRRAEEAEMRASRA